MRINKLSIQIYLAVALLASALIGCSDNNDTTDQDITAANNLGTSMGTDLATQAQAELAGNSALVAIAKIGSIIHTINDGEIMEAQLVLTLTQNTSALDFANKMIADHSANNATLDAMLAAMQITPLDNSVSQRLRAETAADISELQSTAEADVPRVYFQIQIAQHQEAFVLTGTFVNVSTGTSFDQYIVDTRAMLAAHRDEAEQRFRTLGLR